MRSIHRVFSVAVVVGMALSSTGYSRIFTNSEGRKISADISGIHGTDVELKMGVKKFRVPIESLSKDDQAFIAQWERENKDYKLRFSTKEAEDEEKREREGNGRKERKNVRSTWRYETSITNLSGTDLENLQVHYNYFLRTTSTAKLSSKKGNNKKETPKTKTGFLSIPMIENSQDAHFVTDWENIVASEWQVQRSAVDSEGDVYYYHDNYTDETIVDGIWVRVYLDSRMISEWKSEGKVIKDALWQQPAGAPQLVQVAKAQPKNTTLPIGGGKQMPPPNSKPSPNPKPQSPVVSGDGPTAEEMENNPTLLPPLPQPPEESASAEAKAAFAEVEKAREAHQKGQAGNVTFLNLQKLQNEVVAKTSHYKSLL